MASNDSQCMQSFALCNSASDHPFAAEAYPKVSSRRFLPKKVDALVDRDQFGLKRISA